MLTILLIYILEMFVCAYFINGLLKSFEHGNVLHWFKIFVVNNLHSAFHKPLVICVRCMASFWGTLNLYQLNQLTGLYNYLTIYQIIIMHVIAIPVMSYMAYQIYED